MTQPVITGLAITIVAGLTMCLGATLGLLLKRRNTRMQSFILGFAAGLMVVLALMEMMPEAIESLEASFPHSKAHILGVIVFIAGVLLLALIDKLIPIHNHSDDSAFSHYHSHESIGRSGAMLALFIGLHNIPEGMALFVASMDGLSMAIPLLIGIAIHNIPEGLAIYSPVYYASGKKGKAMLYTLLSALATPLGALLGILFLLPYWTPTVNGICLAAVAGSMIYLCFDELIPEAESAGSHSYTMAGIITGMATMALCLVLAHGH